MRPSDEHLAPGDFYLLLDDLAHEGAVQPGSGLEELVSHVAVCRECAKTLEAYRRADEDLSSLRRAAVEDAENPMTSEETEFVASLDSARSPWQRDVAVRMSLQPRPLRTRRAAGLAWAAGIVIAAVGLATWLLQRGDPVELLLARAYTANRPMEFRLPDAGYREVAHVKGSPAPGILAQPDLLEAARRINGADPSPVQLRQRAHMELLELGHSEALKTLDGLPDDPGNWLLLACAYYLRAESQGESSAQDWARALEYLEKLRQKNPHDRLALFNIALVQEQMSNRDAAIAAWDAYLNEDSSSGYGAEARRRREELKKQKQARDRVLGIAGGAPELFLEAAAADRTFPAELVVDAALSRWLPRGKIDDTGSRAAVLTADLLREQTGDSFLQIALRSPLPSAAVQDLAEAIVLDRSADPLSGERKAAAAAHSFAGAGNTAGELRALTEQVYALHRSARPKECLETARALQLRLERTPYAWMRVQNRIETAVCLAYLGELAEAMDTAEAAAREAAGAHLSGLELRAEGMLSGFLVQIGDVSAAWRLVPENLRAYWAGSFPVNHAHQFYGDIGDAALRAGLPHAGYLFRRSAIDAISQTRERLLEASGRNILSLAALRGGYQPEAAEEFRKSRALFDGLPDSRLKTDYVLDADLMWTAQQIKDGRAGSTLPLLYGLLAKPIPTDGARVRVLENLSLALWQTGRVSEARDVAVRSVGRNQQLASSLPSPGSRIMATRRQVAAYRLLSELELSQKRDPYAAFVWWQMYRSLQSSPVALHFDPASSGDTRARIDEWARALNGATFLSFADLPGGPVVWLLDSDGLLCARLDQRAEAISAAADALLRQCANPHSDAVQLKQSAETLGHTLLGPLGGRVHPDRILVLDADSPFARTPFAVLFAAGPRAIVRSAGLAEFLDRATTPSLNLSESRLLLAYAPAALPDARLARLYPAMPEAEREANDVAVHFAGVERLSGKGATRSALSRSLRGADVFHFSGHGSGDSANGALLFSAEDPGRPYSGFLTAAEIGRLDWSRCRLAVLSACATAVGEQDGPVNPESLVRAILNARAGRVVASQWSVEARGTRLLMAAFYRQMGRGSPPALALQEAAAEVRAQPGMSHPYYWAAFQIFG